MLPFLLLLKFPQKPLAWMRCWNNFAPSKNKNNIPQLRETSLVRFFFLMLFSRSLIKTCVCVITKKHYTLPRKIYLTHTIWKKIYIYNKILQPLKINPKHVILSVAQINEITIKSHLQRRDYASQYIHHPTRQLNRGSTRSEELLKPLWITQVYALHAESSVWQSRELVSGIHQEVWQKLLYIYF